MFCEAPVNKGLLCVKGYHLPGFLYGEDRLRYPLRRKEDGSLERISWDAALDLIAEKFSGALEEHGPCDHDSLAEQTGLNSRYLREWLSANAAFGYVEYDPDGDTFSLSPEQAAIFSHEGEPTCMQGFFQAVIGQIATHDTAVDVFQSGRGRPWGEHHTCCFCGTDRFFRPGYVANLVDNWIPALNGVQEKLQAGAHVADIGCGRGSSSILLAKHFPKSNIHGFDFHQPSIQAATEEAGAAGVSNVEFRVSTAKEFPGNEYDLICIFDALHDMGDLAGPRIVGELGVAVELLAAERLVGRDLDGLDCCTLDWIGTGYRPLLVLQNIGYRSLVRDLW